MKKLLTIMFACFMITATTKAQTASPAIPTTQAYGKIDKADLELKSCDFEKDANAMVLFDKADVYYDDNLSCTMERHKRIKIFNDNGKDAATIRIEFISTHNYEYITGLQAETINLTDGKTEITKLDKKALYTQSVDKFTSAYVFSLPNVKPGSVIEYKYTIASAFYNLPNWFFQNKLPVRYSEQTTSIPDFFGFNVQSHVRQPYVVNKTSQESKSIGTGMDAILYNNNIKVRALANVHSLQDEPFMSSRSDNLQGLIFQFNYFKPIYGFTQTYSNTWAKVGGLLADDDDFGGQLKRKLANEEAIISKAKALPTELAKLIYLYKEVQNSMKWNGEDQFKTNDGTAKAWEKKSGNSAEVNLILYHLLNKAGVTAYPMVVSTREHGRVNPAFSYLYQFNRAVVYAPVDSAHHYILDATNKYNVYSEIPYDLLNSTGLYIDGENKTYNTIFLHKKQPSMQAIVVTADIKPDGNMAGTVQMSGYSYNRINCIKKYKTDGEEKYIDYLRDNDNSLKISSLKFENMDIDSLPLNQNADFKEELTGSDGNYIYLKTSTFSPLRVNPFLSENRMSDIDFGCRNNFSMVGNYKIPAGYKAEALPKSITMQMPDKSIVFRRLVGEQDGSIVVRYVMDYKKDIYYKEDYPEIFDFYKKLNELMNEQIVLKKS